MKVCIVSHAFVEQGYRPVLAALAAQPGVELALITPNRYKLGLQSSSGDFSSTDAPCRTYAIPIRWGARQGAFIYHASDLSNSLDDFKPDIVLHEQEVFALGAGQLAWMTSTRSIPLVMFVWENLHRSLAMPRRLLMRYVLNSCSGLITGSTGSAAVHKAWGFRGPVEVIPQMGTAALNANPRFGLRSPGTLHVSFAGSLIRDKGIECLLRAVAQLSAKGINIKCSIAGKGPDKDRLVALSKTLHIEDRVHFAGLLTMESVAELFKQSDVLALPSRRTKVWEEQFGRVLVEAMAQATVTVGSNTGAIPEVIDSGDLIFDENDHNGLASILERCYTDPVFFEAQQRRLWMRAREHYLNEVLAARKVQFMTTILQLSSKH
jgi:glycosyltransferase involved in cell wall biosynthesis